MHAELGISIAIGLAISLLLGSLITAFFFRLLLRHLKVGIDSIGDGPRIPFWLIGVVERSFFTTVVAFDLSGAAVGMIGWITVKMVSNWNRQAPSTPEQGLHGSQIATAALLASLVSMLFATTGGLIIRRSMQ